METAEKIFGLNVRKARKSRNISQEKLASLAKMDRAHMGEIERGNVSPSLKTMNQIAQALDMPVSELLD